MKSTKSKTKKRPNKRKTDLGYVHARELVGRSLLVLGLIPLQSQHQHPYFRCAVDARLSNGQRLHFPAGVMVEQQIRETPVLPVWVRLLWQQGHTHPYYQLELAETVEVKVRRPRRKRAKAEHFKHPQNNPMKGTK